MSDEFDFSKISYRVDELTDVQDPFEAFPIFQKYPEFHEKIPLPRDKVLKYIVYVYDRYSPLMEELQDLFKVKVRAAELAGFKRNNKNVFPRQVEDLFLCVDENICAMIVRYITLNKSVEYSEYAVLSESYFIQSKNLLLTTEPDIKNLQVTKKGIVEAREELLSGDSMETLRKQLFRFYLEDKLELRPEDIARKLAKAG